MEKRIVFTGKQQVELQEFAAPKVKSGEIGVRTIVTLMSIGTENICFNRLFEPGTGWEEWVKYPFYPGYLLVGEVEEVGAGVEGFKAGDRVGLRKEHWSYHAVPAGEAVRIPEGIDAREAAWFGLARIAFMGAKILVHHLGDTVLVIGAGPIGQMSLRWAVAAGAETVIVTDMWPKRLKMAERGGATHVIGRPVEECREEILAANNGAPPRLIIDSTGNAKVFAEALKLAGRKGRILLVGDTGTPSNQCLTGDVIAKGLTIVGAHDKHADEEWTSERIYRLFFSLAARGRFSLKGLNTHSFKPEECVKAYTTVNKRRGDTMGVLFDWRA